MTKRIWLLVAVVSLAIAAGLVLFVFRSEPSYQGRKLTSWIEDLSITVAYWSFDSRGQAIARVGPTRVFINAGSPWGTEEPRTREAIRFRESASRLRRREAAPVEPSPEA